MVTGCGHETKQAAIYSGSVKEYEDGDAEQRAAGPPVTSSTGTLAVPDDAPPGDYTVVVSSPTRSARPKARLISSCTVRSR